jgi:Rieske Fe-S protein
MTPVEPSPTPAADDSQVVLSRRATLPLVAVAVGASGLLVAACGSSSSPSSAAKIAPAAPGTTGARATTAGPTTAEPATAQPASAEPTTAQPATAEPTTAQPTTQAQRNQPGTTAQPAPPGPLLASSSRVPAGGGLILTGPRIVLARDPGGTLHAFTAVCTHMGCTVGSVSGGVIMCPCHGSRYNASTGAVVNGPAPRPLAPIAVTVQDGNIYQG